MIINKTQLYNELCIVLNDIMCTNLKILVMCDWIIREYST